MWKMNKFIMISYSNNFHKILYNPFLYLPLLKMYVTMLMKMTNKMMETPTIIFFMRLMIILNINLLWKYKKNRILIPNHIFKVQFFGFVVVLIKRITFWSMMWWRATNDNWNRCIRCFDMKCSLLSALHQ